MNVQARDLAVEFAYRFGRMPTVSRAPGRVNLIGEHTDYNDGFVMPAALEFATLTAAAPRPDRRLRVYSMIMDETREFDLDCRLRRAGATTGPTMSSASPLMLEKSGRRLSGADLVIFTDVPIGSGLSSSAALEVCSAHALLTAAGLPFDADRNRQTLPARRERLCRHALRGHGPIYLLLRRRRTCAPDRLPHLELAQCRDRAELEASRRQFHVRHQHAGGEYNARREACEEGVRLLSRHLGPIKALRDVTPDRSRAPSPRAPRPHLSPLPPYRHRERARARGGAGAEGRRFPRLRASR